MKQQQSGKKASSVEVVDIANVEILHSKYSDPIDSNAQTFVANGLQWGREDEWIAPVPQSDWTSGSAKLDPCVLPTPSFRKFEWVGESGAPKSSGENLLLFQDFQYFKMFRSDFFFKIDVQLQEYSEKKRAVNLPFLGDSEEPGTIQDRKSVV